MAPGQVWPVGTFQLSCKSCTKTGNCYEPLQMVRCYRTTAFIDWANQSQNGSCERIEYWNDCLWVLSMMGVVSISKKKIYGYTDTRQWSVGCFLVSFSMEDNVMRLYVIEFLEFTIIESHPEHFWYSLQGCYTTFHLSDISRKAECLVPLLQVLFRCCFTQHLKIVMWS